MLWEGFFVLLSKAGLSKYQQNADLEKGRCQKNYMWVLTCRRVCRGRSAIREQKEKENKMKLVHVPSNPNYSRILRSDGSCHCDPDSSTDGEKRCSAPSCSPRTHPLLDHGMFVLHLPLLHRRIDHQLVQLKAERRTPGTKVRKKVYEVSEAR